MIHFLRAQAIDYYSCGLVLFVAFLVTVIKIYRTSKSQFAFTLLSFTALFALNYILYGAYYQFIDNKQPYLIQEFAKITIQIQYFICSIQGWIFATKYVECVLNFSFDTKKLNYLVYIKWGVITVYSLYMYIEYLTSLILLYNQNKNQYSTSTSFNLYST